MPPHEADSIDYHRSGNLLAAGTANEADDPGCAASPPSGVSSRPTVARPTGLERWCGWSCPEHTIDSLESNGRLAALPACRRRGCGVAAAWSRRPGRVAPNRFQPPAGVGGQGGQGFVVVGHLQCSNHSGSTPRWRLPWRGVGRVGPTVLGRCLHGADRSRLWRRVPPVSQAAAPGVSSLTARRHPEDRDHAVGGAAMEGSAPRRCLAAGGSSCQSVVQRRLSELGGHRREECR